MSQPESNGLWRASFAALQIPGWIEVIGIAPKYCYVAIASGEVWPHIPAFRYEDIRLIGIAIVQGALLRRPPHDPYNWRTQAQRFLHDGFPLIITPFLRTYCYLPRDRLA